MFFIILIITNLASSANSDDHGQENVWTGKWFPKEPVTATTTPFQDLCDDLEDETDFNSITYVADSQFLCLDKNKYEPNVTIFPIQRENIIPPAFKPNSVCSNEPIIYPFTLLPTFGSFRPRPPLYGDYKFLPIQRWMHTLKLGGVVGLYHPCANTMQILKLKSLIQSCLYSYVITPSNLLSKDRPLAVLSSGRSLEMSVFEPHLIKDFIQSKKKPVEMVANTQWYTKDLLREAKLVTTLLDEKLCPYSE